MVINNYRIKFEVINFGGVIIGSESEEETIEYFNKYYEFADLLRLNAITKSDKPKVLTIVGE